MMLRKEHAVLLKAALLVVVLCGSLATQANAQRLQFYQGMPESAEDRGTAVFSDRGSWMGFAIPLNDQPLARGGFVGPYLHAEHQWLGASLLVPSITIGSTTHTADELTVISTV